MQPQDAAGDAQGIPAPEIRITPEELTNALAAIEARKREEALRQEEEARYLARTLPIGQAVHDLSLDATPEEIWVEVQTQRAAAAPPPEEALPWVEDTEETSEPFFHGQIDRETQREPQPTFFWKGLAAFAVLALGLPALIGRMTLNNARPPAYNVGPTTSWPTAGQLATPSQGSYTSGQGMNPFSRIASTMDGDFYRKLRLCQGPNPTYTLTHVDVWPPRPYGLQPVETVYPVRAVPDGYSIFNDRIPGYPMDFPMSRGGVVFRAVSDSESMRVQGSQIITTRYNGVQYIRCWIAQNEIGALEHHHRVTFYFCLTGPDTPDSANLMPVTIKLFRREGGQDVPNLRPKDATMTREAAIALVTPTHLVAPEGQSITLDAHAYENFPDMTLPAYVPPEWAKIPGVFNDFPSFSIGPSNLQIMEEYRGFDASSSVENIEAVPNNQLFHGGVGTILKLAGQPVSSVYGSMPRMYNTVPDMAKLVDVRPHLNQPYTFVKYNGNVYVRGWTAERLTGPQLQGHVISVAADPTSPSFVHPPVQIQLRLDTCTVSISMNSGQLPYSPYSSGDYAVVASNIHPDQYTWEKW